MREVKEEKEQITKVPIDIKNKEKDRKIAAGRKLAQYNKRS